MSISHFLIVVYDYLKLHYDFSNSHTTLNKINAKNMEIIFLMDQTI